MPKPNRKRSKAKRGPIFGNDPAPVRSSSAAIKNHLKPYQTKFVAEVVEVGYGDNQGKARVRRAGDEITIALPEAEPAGSTSLFIKNTIGFHFGQQIVLMRDDGSVTEDALVNSISEQDGTITLKNPTANAFAAGDKVRTISGRGFYDVVGGSVRVGDSCWCLSDTGGIVILAGGSGGGPIGSSCPYHGTSDPPGGEYLIEDKRSLLISEYPELFDVIGTRYGQGNSPGLTFNLPDTRGMTYIGAGNSPNFTNRPLGTMGGSESVALVAADMPIHNHSGSTSSDTHNHSGATNGGGAHNHNGQTNQNGSHDHGYVAHSSLSNVQGNASGITDIHRGAETRQSGNSPNHAHGIDNEVAHAHAIPSDSHSHSLTINNAGGGGSHENMQPWIAAYWIMKVR